MEGFHFLPDTVRASAREYEGEYCWPRSAAGEAIDAIAASGRAISNVEFWVFDRGHESPRVVGLSTYRLAGSTEWPDVVEDSRRNARSELDSRRVDEAWVHVHWIDEMTLSTLRSKAKPMDD